MTVLLVAGSRDMPRELVWRELDRWARVYGDPHVVVHGCCRGADEAGGQWAHRRGIRVLEFPADWSRGPKAGPERNHQMVQYLARHATGLDAMAVVVRFPGSRGSADVLRRLRKAGIPTRDINVPRFGA